MYTLSSVAMLIFLLPFLILIIGGLIIELMVGCYSEPSASGVLCKEKYECRMYGSFMDVRYYFCFLFVTPKDSFV